MKCVSLTATLMNTSKSTIQGPLKGRVLTLESGLGVAQITNADNGQHGTGAVWDFTQQLNGGKLASLARSKPRTLTFHISDLRPLRPGKDFNGSFLSLNVRFFAKTHAPEKHK